MNESSITKPVGIMPNHLDLREITFTNLLLLDFNPDKMESKYRVVFNRDMFVLPNKKAMEVVMHFLFTRLHPQLAHEELRDCWPIRDKFLEQQFRKVCFNWVSRIQKEDPEARLPRIVQSLFHSPGGDRFYNFLHHFSLYVLTKVMHRDHGNNILSFPFHDFQGKVINVPTFPTKTIHNHSFTHIMSQALKAHYIVLKKRFLEFTQQAVQIENQWKEYAMESTKEYRALAKLKRDLERQVMELNGLIAPRGPTVGIKTDYQEEAEALKRTQKLQQVRDLWSGITEFYSMQGPQRRMVDSVLLGEANKYKVDAADIQPMVPDMLLRDSGGEIRKRNIQDIYIGGKVNLLSLLQLWNLSLSEMRDQICQDPLPGFQDYSLPVKSAIHSHHAHLENTIALREAIERTMPDMKESVRKMKLRSYKNLEQKGGKPAEAPVMFKLGLVPPSPPVSFAAADTPAAERMSSFNKSLMMSPDAVSTPDVIQAWTKSTRRKQLEDQQEFHSNHTKQKAMEPSRLPRPKPQVSSKLQTRDGALVASKTTKRKEKKPSTQRQRTEEHIRYPPYVTPRTEGRKYESKELSLLLKPQTLLAEEIANAVAGKDSTSSSLSSSAASSRANTPKPQALVDPVGALGQDAFQPRDLIPRTPSKPQNGGTAATVPRAMTDPKRGRLLEAIIDESTSPTQEKPSTDRSPQADLSWSDIICSPRLHTTPQNIELPLGAISHTDVNSIGDDLPRNDSFIQLSPKIFMHSLSAELLKQQKHVISPHGFPSGTPEPVRAPMATGSSPQLDSWLLPQNGNSSTSRDKALPLSVGLPPSEGTSSNDKLPFRGLGFLSGTRKPFTSQSEKHFLEERAADTKGVQFERSSQQSPRVVPLSSPLIEHTTPDRRDFSFDHVLDTRELSERLSAISETSALRDSRALGDDSSAKPTPSEETLKHADTSVARGTPSLHVTNTTDVNSSGKNPLASSTKGSHIEGLNVQTSTLSGLPETFLTPTKRPTSNRSSFPKQSSLENVSSTAFDIDTSTLIQRLNTIKLRQQSFSTPLTETSRSFESSEPAPVSRTSLLVNRLDQIKQAQNSQQVTPGANVDGDLNTSRTSEPALLTPLTPSSRDTPSEDGSKNESVNFSFNSPLHVTSLSESPSSPLDSNVFLHSPFKREQVNKTSLQETPCSPSMDTSADLKITDLQWEETTPTLPKRLVGKTDPIAGVKNSDALTKSNGLQSSLLDPVPSPPVKSDNLMNEANSCYGSNYSPVRPDSVGERAELDGSLLLDLASPYSNGGHPPTDPRSLWKDAPQPPLVGPLIDLE